MEKTYQPKTIEQHWSAIWEQQGAYQPSGQGKAFCIMLPPPNVTGSLHMGHGFQQTLMDILTRYHRMCGDNTLWQPGTDHAGIATQMVVERQLSSAGITRQALGREAFTDKVWQWKQQSGERITQQIRRLGASADWLRARFTLDVGLSAAVQEVFIRLYQEKLIYRGQRLVNWDPKLGTAVSDLEVVSTEEQGTIWHIAYPLANGSGQLVVATTRPETLFGDAAVAVHPDDTRYQHLIGQELMLPLAERPIPIIADNSVEPEFGTGCVKITPAHDFNDYAVGQRHGLPLINILTPTAHLNENVPAAFQGLERLHARKQVLAALEQAHLLVKAEPHTLKVPRGDRTQEIIEPYLTQQWFVKTKPLAEAAIEAVKKGDIRFVPENWRKTYFQWLEQIEDWCISRQLWWGHRIPAWYDTDHNVYVGSSVEAIRQQYNLGAEVELRQDEDVLDTWFSSALWPFSTLGWPEQTPELSTFYPTSVLITGFDIIFFWVARMVMLGLKFTGQVPFKEVYIHGLVRDAEGQKMSKSKGNVLDPLDIIDGISLEELIAKRISGLMQPEMAAKIAAATRKQFPDGIAAHGTDALRFSFCALANTSRDIRFDLQVVAGYRNFCNKLWNAARFVLMNIEGKAIADAPSNQLTLPDRWIRSRLVAVIEEAHQTIKEYRFDWLAQALYNFTWNDYCDWYIELAKLNLSDSNANPEQQAATRYTLVSVLETLLRLLHPIIPFITEALWQKAAPLIGKGGTTIMLALYPQADIEARDVDAEAEMSHLQQVLLAIRQIRSEMTIPPGKQLPELLLRKGRKIERDRINRNQTLLLKMAKIDTLRWLDDEEPPVAATAITGGLELFIPLAQFMDIAAERARLQKELAKLANDQQAVTARLHNSGYLAKAPAAVVEKERLRAQELNLNISKLEEQLAMLANLQK